MTDPRETSWSAGADAPGFLAAEAAAHAVLQRKGENVVVLDLRGRSDVADFFLIASGGSQPQVEAMTKAVREALFRLKQKPLHVEGTEQSQWVLMDFVDLVVHLMQPRSREYYELERLWNDAPRLEVDVAYFGRDDVAARHPDLELVRRARAADPEQSGADPA
ncbi:MAG TPA: ribosome silencing factor [Candidatus Krumholzibacteria bacterium]|nr:ribosome silencing factor [Candidatus Krumholzibacteria bacterium]